MLYDSGYHHGSFLLFSLVSADLCTNLKSFHPRRSLVSRPIPIEVFFLLNWMASSGLDEDSVFVSGALIELFLLVCS